MQLADLDLSGTYTYADYLKWSFDERLELIKGKIFPMSPGPNTVHQIISIRIATELGLFLKHKTCMVFSAPFDVRLARKPKLNKDVTTVVQPDICVICDQSKLDKRGCIGSPNIVVEILSPGNNKKELQNKYNAYEEAMVQEYWLISPQDKSVIRYTLGPDFNYSSLRPMTMGDEVTTPILPGFVLNLDELFSGNLSL